MNTDRDKLVKEIFADALEKSDAAERATYLAQACGNDAQLRQQVEALLQAHEKAGGFLEEPAVAPPGKTVVLSTPLTEKPGDRIGRYKLREKIGEGGCGVVYVAEQEEPVRRRVALKVIKLGMDTKAVIARFEAERQALAMMDHPNIAKVLDAGTTETGRPYFVMELVRGIRITDYCDQNKLSTPERLGLFMQVCHAVQHAHQKGIIHRDIKPSNILVTLHDGVPVPKVIDFGIAKATEGRLTDLTVYTELHQFIGTPAYMSPEQAEMSGLDIDTRSDIYSLGVLLYELLTGKTPFDPQELLQSGLDAMRRTIREQEPPRPSTRLSTMVVADLTAVAQRHGAEPPRLIHLIRGDLDWITMKALEKDRTRRYETANGLAQDLERHLKNETIIARPPSPAYRLQKLVQRNKLAFAAAGAVLAALVIGLGVSIFLYIKADKAREAERKQHQLADTARGQMEGIISFMMQDLQPALEQSGRLPLLKQIAEKVVRHFDVLPLELRDSKMESAQARALEAMAGFHLASGDRASAEVPLRKSIELARRVVADNPNDPDAAAFLLEVNWWWQFYFTGKQTRAEEVLATQQNLQQWRQLHARYADNISVKKGLARALVRVGIYFNSAYNKPAEAIAAIGEARTLAAELLAAEPNDRLTRYLDALTYIPLATAYEQMNEREKSVQLSEEALARLEKELKSDPGNQDLMYNAAEAAQNLSYRVATISQKRSRDAELVAREHYRLLSELDPADMDRRHYYAMSHMMECYYLQADGQIEAARQAFKKFDSLLQPAAYAGANIWARVDLEKLMEISAEQASLAAAAGDVADARAQLATGKVRFQEYYDKLPAGSFDQLQARVRWLNWQSEALLTLGDWLELDGVARDTLATIEDGLRQQPADAEMLLRQAVAQGFLGAALLGQGNAQEAAAVLEKSVAGYREAPIAPAFKEDREAFAMTVTESLAGALSKTGDLPRARTLLESALAVRESKLTKEPDLWGLNEAVARTSFLLATVLDLSNPQDTARRKSLLDRSTEILNGPDAEGRLSVADKELKAKIQALRPSQPAKAGW
jgi:serine/threonine protein kinase